MGGNFFVFLDLERLDGVLSFGGDGSLIGELFKDFGGMGKLVIRFIDGDVFWGYEDVLWIRGEVRGKGKVGVS